MPGSLFSVCYPVLYQLKRIIKDNPKNIGCQRVFKQNYTMMCIDYWLECTMGLNTKTAHM